MRIFGFNPLKKYCFHWTSRILPHVLKTIYFFKIHKNQQSKLLSHQLLNEAHPKLFFYKIHEPQRSIIHGLQRRAHSLAPGNHEPQRSPSLAPARAAGRQIHEPLRRPFFHYPIFLKPEPVQRRFREDSRRGLFSCRGPRGWIMKKFIFFHHLLPTPGSSEPGAASMESLPTPGSSEPGAGIYNI